MKIITNNIDRAEEKENLDKEKNKGKDKYGLSYESDDDKDDFAQQAKSYLDKHFGNIEE